MQKNLIFICAALCNFQVFHGMQHDVLTVLKDKQSSCVTGPNGFFIFNDEDKSKIIIDAVKKEPQTVDKIQENLKEIKKNAQSFRIDDKHKKGFQGICVTLEKYLENTKKSRDASKIISDSDATVIGLAAHRISVLYGILYFLDRPNKK